MWTRFACSFLCVSHLRFWLAGAPSTLTAVVLAASETNRPPFGARRSRKLARLRAENLPLQRFESNMPHLPAEELEIAIQDPRSRRLLKPNLHTSRLPIDLQRTHDNRGWGGGTEKPERSEAGQSWAKECSSILAREIIKKFMFTVTIHMTVGDQWRNRTTHKVVLQSCKFS